jgi:hypothetical protein
MVSSPVLGCASSESAPKGRPAQCTSGRQVARSASGEQPHQLLEHSEQDQQPEAGHRPAPAAAPVLGRVRDDEFGLAGIVKEGAQRAVVLREAMAHFRVPPRHHEDVGGWRSGLAPPRMRDWFVNQ